MSNKNHKFSADAIRTIAAAAVLCGICSAFTACGAPVSVKSSAPEKQDESAQEQTAPAATEKTTAATTKALEPAADSATVGEKNALKKAQSYLSFMAFSESGLVEHLKFEGFSDAEAQYGAANCGADWNEQAAKKAESYLDLMSFSREGIIEQLEFEGFTHERRFTELPQ